jgi:hypothetical protein
MKKFLMIAVATSVLTAPAFAAAGGNGQGNQGNGNGNGGPAGAAAATWQGQTYDDNLASYKLSATNATFCKFGNAGNSAASGGDSSTTFSEAHNSGYAGGDAAYVLDIQNDGDNTVRAASANFDFARFVCNTPFAVKASSSNGGLKSANSTSDSDFVSLIAYNINVTMDGVEGSQKNISTSNQDVLTSTEARAGAAQVRIRVPAQDKLVLQGAYNDVVLLTMTPNA